ncbi:hypothetical protein BU16DRAFT_619074 [Lophium mytilinum]|uniref:Uncharacterized protein n=1 Tax=Lophium mytilinum TaxID=390894 RepID=A0A6A6QPD4_9PEZI|nr:hypothetical protein BU16DRAFT_619074 [Lophium mytilinum]
MSFVPKQFFEAAVWKESAVDVFVKGECNAQALGKKGNNELHIVALEHTSIHYVLAEFSSTAGLNIITWNQAYALFPLPTLIQHKAYVSHEPNDHIGRLLQKYTDRGWKTQHLPWPEKLVLELTPFRHTRRIGDGYTWRLTLDTTNVKPSKVPDYVLQHAQFSIQVKPHRRYSWLSWCQITADPFTSHTLKYECTFGNKGSQGTGETWLQFLGKRVRPLTYMELIKVNADSRPNVSPAHSM